MPRLLYTAVALACFLGLLGYHLAAAESETALDGEHGESVSDTAHRFFVPHWPFAPKPQSGSSHAHAPKSGSSHAHKSRGTPKELVVEPTLPLNGHRTSPPKAAKDGHQHSEGGETTRFFLPGWPFAPKPKSGGSHAPKSSGSSHTHKSGGSNSRGAERAPFFGIPGGSHAPKSSGNSHTHKSGGSNSRGGERAPFFGIPGWPFPPEHMHGSDDNPEEVNVASTLPLKGDGTSPDPKNPKAVSSGHHNNAKGDHGASPHPKVGPHHHRKTKLGAGSPKNGGAKH